jgi:nucleoside-diphosphate-sugar epimerase
MNILLTGSDGFIGQNLQNHFKEKHNIICLDKASGNDLLNCDLKHNVDLVIHLAGLSGVRDSLNNPTGYWINNVIAGQRLFDFFKDTRILYASSSVVYESWRNPYGITKHALEMIAPKNSVGMRFTTVYGPNAKKDMLIPRILRNDVPFIHTNHTRDFIHVNDIISAIETLMSSDFTGVLDIGTGETNNLVQLVDYFGIECERLVGKENERLDNKADISILKDLGWKPKVDLYSYIEDQRHAN